MVVIFCHGFGMSAPDFASLCAKNLEPRGALDARIRYVFPNAPISLAERSLGRGHAWWLFPIHRLVAAQKGTITSEELVNELRLDIPAGLPDARNAMLALIADISAQTKLPMSRIVIAGFSQGAVLATDVALHIEEAPLMLCLFTASLTNESEWTRLVSRRRGLPVFQAHGQDDVVFPLQSGAGLHDLFNQSGLDVEFLRCAGGHAIAKEAWDRLASRLGQLL